MKRTELKLSINCSKCKTQVLKAVAKLEGVDKVAVDAERGILTVVGDVDPVRVATKVRKSTGKHAEIIYMGAPERLVDPLTPDHLLLPSCPHCTQLFINYTPFADHSGAGFCCIM